MLSVSTQLESPAPISSSSIRSSRSPPQSSPTTIGPLLSSALSSPFMGKMSLAQSIANKPVEEDDIFSIPKAKDTTTGIDVLSTPPRSPARDPVSSSIVQSGGEMERLRHIMMEETRSRIQEAEQRRPDYLMRAKRPLSGTDPTYFEAEDGHEHWPSIGVMDSPQKGRRLKLFQETSDESFEESLMAGGYGRYVCSALFSSFYVPTDNHHSERLIGSVNHSQFLFHLLPEGHRRLFLSWRESKNLHLPRKSSRNKKGWLLSVLSLWQPLQKFILLSWKGRDGCSWKSL